MITTCPNRFASGVEPLVIKTVGGHVVYVLDGSGSWGAGAEAAAWFRQWITAESCGSEYSPKTVTELLAAGIGVLPREITDCDFHWSFSVAVAICQCDSVQVGASGSIAAIAMRSNKVDRLFVPKRLVDELVSHGTISPDEAETHKYRRIICGPFFGHDNNPELHWCAQVPWRECDRVVLGDAALPQFLANHPFTFQTARHLRDAIECFGGSSTSTVILDSPLNAG